ncbi:MAG: hypothetical protein K2X39_08070, partial [Silvanigrellaceae bacterium]|nr:hypothetical protein [Silvanigrellaceae bacterium]
MQKPFYLPVTVPSNEALRLYWNRLYYKVDCVLLFPDQLKDSEMIHQAAHHQLIILKLTPFQNEFRAKMLAEINGSSPSEKINVLAITLNIDLVTKTIHEIKDIRQLTTDLQTNIEEQVSFEDDEHNVLTLSTQEQQELIHLLDKHLKMNFAKYLNEPFVCFMPELAGDEWKAKLTNIKSGKKALVPYQALFPLSGNMTRLYQNKVYFIDDLYCLNPMCDCQEVTCVILTLDESSNQETVFGGFKYHLQKKTFKIVSDFPSSFNAQQWFKEFSASF